MDLDAYSRIAAFLVILIGSIYTSLFFIFSHHKNSLTNNKKSVIKQYAGGLIAFIALSAALWMSVVNMLSSGYLDTELLLFIFPVISAGLSILLGLKWKYVGIGYIIGIASAVLLFAMFFVELLIHPPDEE
jgi:hypothetical protein